jgi:hypothetical protein
MSPGLASAGSGTRLAQQRTPECERVDDRNAVNLAQAEKVGVCADDVVGAAGRGSPEELVSVRISAPYDSGRGSHHGAFSPEEFNQRSVDDIQ